MGYDTTVIRPEMHDADVRMSIDAVPAADRTRVRRALITLHTLELMAVNIYRCQITPRSSALNRALIAAMCNEMTHFQDFQVKLYEHGWRPSPLRWAYGIAGFVIGLGSRLMGEKAILRTGVWVESKAVRHYSELLGRIAWDEQTRAIIEKNQADEYGHIERWRAFLRGGG
jgi:demethoxyubiquinone hydroxylase (CLK1/Coq7/Cat5 family)